MEGGFFIVLGIKSLVVNRDIKKQEAIFGSLPMQKSDVEAMTTSQAAGAKLSSGLFGVQDKLQKILSKNNYVS